MAYARYYFQSETTFQSICFSKSGHILYPIASYYVPVAAFLSRNKRSWQFGCVT